jgi:hypothetical protein
MLARTAIDVTPARLGICVFIFCSRLSVGESGERLLRPDFSVFQFISTHEGFGAGWRPAYDPLPDPP